VTQEKYETSWGAIFKGDVFEDVYGTFIVLGQDPSTKKILIFDITYNEITKIYFNNAKKLLARLDQHGSTKKKKKNARVDKM
jgi:hypothetical protein